MPIQIPWWWEELEKLRKEQLPQPEARPQIQLPEYPAGSPPVSPEEIPAEESCIVIEL